MSEERGQRGAVTDLIKSLSKSLLGYEIETLELRLMVYIGYVMVNERRIKIEHINSDERKILRKWKDNDWITGGAGEDMTIDQVFWNSMQQLLYFAYADCKQ